MKTFITTYKKHIIVFLLLIAVGINGAMFVALLILNSHIAFFLGMSFTCIVGIIILQRDFFEDI